MVTCIFQKRSPHPIFILRLSDVSFPQFSSFFLIGRNKVFAFFKNDTLENYVGKKNPTSPNHQIKPEFHTSLEEESIRKGPIPDRQWPHGQTSVRCGGHPLHTAVQLSQTPGRGRSLEPLAVVEGHKLLPPTWSWSGASCSREELEDPRPHCLLHSKKPVSSGKGGGCSCHN